MKQLHVFLSGDVISVGFRSFVYHTVRRFPDVTGYVRNTEDDRVEVLLEGEEEALQQIYEVLKKGPPSAHVGHAEGNWLQVPQRHYEDFSVLMGTSYE